MVALPSEAPHGAVVASGSRFEMGMELVKRELTNGITGRQGEEVADVGRGLRNALGVVLRAPQQIIPSIANAGTKQRFELWRGGSFPDATTNAVGNVFRTARKGNIRCQKRV